MQLQVRNSVALLAGDGGDAGSAIAARLAENGARIMHAPESGPIDLAVLFLQDGATEFEQIAPTARRIAATLRDGGSMLAVVSVTGVIPMRGDDSAPLQAACIALTRTLAMELAPRGVRVNALAIVAGAEASRRVASHTPRGRTPDPEEIAGAALFLLDPENSYTTGHILVADCGWTIGFGRDF